MFGLQALTSFASLLIWLTWPFGSLSVHAAGTTTSPSSPSSTGCPVSGPLLPRPTDLHKSKYIKEATENLAQVLDDAISGEIEAGWDVKNTSFSIAFISREDGNAKTGHDSDKGLTWEYHHLGENNVNGTKNLDGDSQYLVGSISKIISELILLKSGVSLEDPITEYLPELHDDSSLIQWENITLGALAEHLAGIPTNTLGSFDLYFLEPLYVQMGFPPLDTSDYPECGVAGLNKACSKKDILKSLLTAHPIAEPYSRLVYSQLSYTLMMWALGARTGQDFSEMLEEVIIGPMELTNTGVSPGIDEKAVIPPVERQGWGSDYGFSAPGGGLYSSLNDLSRIVSGILDYSILETPTDVRKWFQPKSLTSSMTTLVGQPWEIQRTVDLDSDHPHTIDIYSKGGGAMGYRSHMSIIDQYGVGFVILAAGPLDSIASIFINQAVMSSLIPAIENETREQAKPYTGQFNSSSTQNDAAPTVMETSMDKGPGLKLDTLTRNGSNILEGIREVYSYALPMMGGLSPEFRLYPTNVEKPDPENKGLVQQDWRINFDMPSSSPVDMSELPGQGKLVDMCTSWQRVDWLYYGGEPVDRIVFTIDKQAGEVVGVEAPFLRSGLLENK